MSLTVNLYYTGTNGSARAFAGEMEKSGLAAAVRAEDGLAGLGELVVLGARHLCEHDADELAELHAYTVPV